MVRVNLNAYTLAGCNGDDCMSHCMHRLGYREDGFPKRGNCP